MALRAAAPSVAVRASRKTAVVCKAGKYDEELIATAVRAKAASAQRRCGRLTWAVDKIGLCVWDRTHMTQLLDYLLLALLVGLMSAEAHRYPRQGYPGHGRVQRHLRQAPGLHWRGEH